MVPGSITRSIGAGHRTKTARQPTATAVRRAETRWRTARLEREIRLGETTAIWAATTVAELEAAEVWAEPEELAGLVELAAQVGPATAAGLVARVVLVAPAGPATAAALAEMAAQA